MIIYTSYFAKLKSLPENIVPISMCGKAPDWYNGAQYKKLAPKRSFFVKWEKNRDNDFYTKSFDEQVLSVLDARRVYEDLCGIAETSSRSDAIKPYTIALVCYEKPEEFCHRH